MKYEVTARRLDAAGSLARAHGAEIRLATGMTGLKEAMNPVELLLSALAACMIKGVERVAPILDFHFGSVEVTLEADRQDSPPKLAAIRYAIVIATAEPDGRIELLHRNILKYGTISNTLAMAVPIVGTIRRA